MPGYQQFQELRDAIDQQNIERIEAFIRAHPDWNYDDIAPNGASALWWALCPAVNKAAAPTETFIKFLLEYRKNDGTALVSPVKMFEEKRPVSYIENSGEIQQLIERFEYHYIAAAVHAEAGLAAIAGDAHNAHDPTVNKLAKENILRLHGHYQAPFDEKEIQDLLQELKQSSSSPFTTAQLTSITASVARCLTIEGNRELDIDQENKIVLTMRQLLGLVWIAVKDTDPTMLPENCKAEEIVMLRSIALMQSLYDAQNAYGDNEVSCWLGTFNRIALALGAQHKLVLAALEGIILTGELANLKMTATMANLVGQLGEDENTRDYYYRLILEELDLDLEPTALVEYATKYYESAIKLAESLTKQSIERDSVDEKEATEFFKTIKQGSAPLAGHRETRYLLLIFRYLQKNNQFNIKDYDKLSPQQALITAKEKASEILAREPEWVASVQAFQQSATQDLAKRFLDEWLNNTNSEEMITLQYSQQSQATNSTQSRLEIAKQEAFNATQEKSQTLKQQTVIKALWDHHKPLLKQTHPSQAAWIEGLTFSQVNELFQGEKITFPLAETTLTKLLTKALQLGITHNLSLSGLIISDQDFRGYNFSGVDLTNTKFVNCDLRLITTDANVKTKGCIVDESCRTQLTANTASVAHYANNNYLFSLLKELSKENLNLITELNVGHTALMAAAQKGYIGCLQAIMDSKHCSVDLLKFQNGGASAFSLAILQDKTKAVKALLNSPFCNKETLKIQNTEGNSVLAVAAENGRKNSFDAILASPHCSLDNLALIRSVQSNRLEFVKAILQSTICTEESLKITNNSYSSALMMASSVDKLEIAQAIISSPHCTEAVLKLRDKFGQTACHIAGAGGRIAQLNAMLASPRFTKAVLEVVDGSGETPLSLAAYSGREACVKAILDSQHCTEATLLLQNSDGYSALMLAAKMGRTPCLIAMLNSKHCTQSVFKLKTKSGNTALLVAAIKGEADCMKALLQSKHCTEEDLKLKDHEDNSALLCAVKYRKSEVVMEIADSKHCTAEVLNLQNSDGENALRLAVRLVLQIAVKNLGEHDYAQLDDFMSYRKSHNLQRSKLTEMGAKFMNALSDLRELSQSNSQQFLAANSQHGIFAKQLWDDVKDLGLKKFEDDLPEIKQRWQERLNQYRHSDGLDDEFAKMCKGLGLEVERPEIGHAPQIPRTY